jgi:translation initiation factor 4A
MTDKTGTENTGKDSFEKWDDVELNKKLLRGIYGYGFEHPSPIQQKAIIPMINRRDIIAQAQSGTGKTGAYSISCLQIIDSTISETQAIILAPTRELARQVEGVIASFSVQLHTKIKLLVGGTNVRDDISDLRENVPHVIVGTPGRVFDMLRSNAIDCKNIKLLVLDEADEILSSGFKEQIYDIFQYLNENTQIGLFSATVPTDLEQLTTKFMRDPVKILVKKEQVTLEGIKQYYVGVETDDDKFAILKDIFSVISMSQCIIYCNSIRRTDLLFDAMLKDGHPVIHIHSGMAECERKESFNDFKAGKARVLIATDLFARGIDIQQVSYVINFDIPKNIHTYIHRIGRSGRWGRKGVGINLLCRRDQSRLKEIETYYGTLIDEMPMNFSENT